MSERDDEDKAYEKWLQSQVGDAHEWAWPPARVVWKAAKAEAAEERKSLQAEVERLQRKVTDLSDEAYEYAEQIERLRNRERDAEKLIRTLAGIANSVDLSAERKMWPVDDDDPAYCQTEQWCKWVEQQEEEAASWLFAYQPERKEEGGG